MDLNDSVRGRPRQRKKRPKTRSGCITCKTRHVKCDEHYPACKKCTSTGRKCDGYTQDNTKRRVTVLSTRDAFAKQAIGGARLTKKLISGAAVSVELDNPEPLLNPPTIERFSVPLFSFEYATDGLPPGRAFHYFIHRSSVDLAGPLGLSIWQDHVLNVCMKSAALQSAIVALAGFHEKYTIPASQLSYEQCWRQYCIAVQNTKRLIEASSSPSQQTSRIEKVVTNEILVACVIFATIELLLGEYETATRHIISGFGLFRAYIEGSDLKSTRYSACDYTSPTSCSPSEPLSTVLPHNSSAKSLLATFSRMDLQLLSFLPKKYYTRRLSATSQEHHSRYEILHLSQSFLGGDPLKLCGIVRRSLYWIHYFATPWKYSPNRPEELYATQKELLQTLHRWKDKYQEGKEPEFHWLATGTAPTTRIAHTLLSYHLMTLKLSVALCPTESIYASADSIRTFCSILCYTLIILKSRNAELSPIYLPKGPIEHYFSLESSIVEALYYASIKCRHSLLRKCALGQLKCAGREGVWDSTLMARVAEYIIGLEEGNTTAAPISSAILSSDDKSRKEKAVSSLSFCIAGRLANELIKKVLLGEHVSDLGNGISTDEKKLVNTVQFEIKKLNAKVEVECGWFDVDKKEWRYKKKMLE